MTLQIKFKINIEALLVLLLKKKKKKKVNNGGIFHSGKIDEIGSGPHFYHIS
jgi:hypothetical protein